MISRRIEVYQFAQINAILEEKFGDDPDLHYETWCIRILSKLW